MKLYLHFYNENEGDWFLASDPRCGYHSDPKFWVVECHHPEDWGSPVGSLVPCDEQGNAVDHQSTDFETAYFELVEECDHIPTVYNDQLHLILHETKYVTIVFKNNELFLTQRKFSHGDLISVHTASFTGMWFSVLYRYLNVLKFLIENKALLVAEQQVWLSNTIECIRSCNALTGYYSDHMEVIKNYEHQL